MPKTEFPSDSAACTPSTIHKLRLQSGYKIGHDTKRIQNIAAVQDFSTRGRLCTALSFAAILHTIRSV